MTYFQGQTLASQHGLLSRSVLLALAPVFLSFVLSTYGYSMDVLALNSPEYQAVPQRATRGAQ